VSAVCKLLACCCCVVVRVNIVVCCTNWAAKRWRLADLQSSSLQAQSSTLKMEAVRIIETHVPATHLPQHTAPTSIAISNTTRTDITAAHLHVAQHMWSHASTSMSVVTKNRHKQISVLTVSTQCVLRVRVRPLAALTYTACRPLNLNDHFPFLGLRHARLATRERAGHS
jgi:hypothetical protein